MTTPQLMTTTHLQSKRRKRNNKTAEAQKRGRELKFSAVLLKTNTTKHWCIHFLAFHSATFHLEKSDLKMLKYEGNHVPSIPLCSEVCHTVCHFSPRSSLLNMLLVSESINGSSNVVHIIWIKSLYFFSWKSQMCYLYPFQIRRGPRRRQYSSKDQTCVRVTRTTDTLLSRTLKNSSIKNCSIYILTTEKDQRSLLCGGQITSVGFPLFPSPGWPLWAK